MTTTDPRKLLDEIKARADDCRTYNFGMRNADRLAHEDAPDMAAALTAVLDLHRKVPIYTDQCDDLDCGREHTEVWAQEYYHSDSPDGFACDECSDDGDDGLSITAYPCLTVTRIQEALNGIA